MHVSLQAYTVALCWYGISIILIVCHFSGIHNLLNISSKPTPPQLDKLILSSVTCGLEQVATQMRLEPTVIVVVKVDYPGCSEETCLRVLNSWLYVKPGSLMTVRTIRSVLRVLEEGGYVQVAVQQWRKHFGDSCEGHVSELAPPPGTHACTMQHFMAPCYVCLAHSSHVGYVWLCFS